MAEGAYIEIITRPGKVLNTKVGVNSLGIPENLSFLVDAGIKNLLSRKIYYSPSNGVEYAGALVNAMVEEEKGWAFSFRTQKMERASYVGRANLTKGILLVKDLDSGNIKTFELPKGYIDPSDSSNVEVGPWKGSTKNPRTYSAPMLPTPLKSVESEITDLKRRAGLLEDN